MLYNISMKNNIIINGKSSNKKGGYCGNGMWTASRLEPSIKYFGSRPVKKAKREKNK
jgi:hypothetical protein